MMSMRETESQYFSHFAGTSVVDWYAVGSGTFSAGQIRIGKLPEFFVTDPDRALGLTFAQIGNLKI